MITKVQTKRTGTKLKLKLCIEKKEKRVGVKYRPTVAVLNGITITSSFTLLSQLL